MDVQNSPITSLAERIQREYQESSKRVRKDSPSAERSILTRMEERSLSYSNAVLDAHRPALEALAPGDVNAKLAEARRQVPSLLDKSVVRQWATLDAREIKKINDPDVRNAAAQTIATNLQANVDYKSWMAARHKEVAALVAALERVNELHIAQKEARKSPPHGIGVPARPENAIREAADQARDRTTLSAPYVVETYDRFVLNRARIVVSRSFHYDEAEVADRLQGHAIREGKQRVVAYRVGNEPAASDFRTAEKMLLYKIPEVARLVDAPEHGVRSTTKQQSQPLRNATVEPAIETVTNMKPRLLDEHFHKDGSEYRFKQNREVIAFHESRRLSGTVLKTDHHDNELVIKGMVDRAIEKGWKALDVQGTPEFRQQVWLEASARGKSVQGFEPSTTDIERLKMRLHDKESHGNTIAQANVSGPTPLPSASPEPATTLKRTELSGQVLEMGRAPYKHLQGEPINYYIKLAERNGNVYTVWGKDLERAAKEITLKVGDQVQSIAKGGEQPVTVSANVRDADNNVVGKELKAAHLNRWVIVKQAREPSPPTLTPMQSGFVKTAGQQVPEEIRPQVEAKATERLLEMARHGMRPKVEVYDPKVASTLVREPRTTSPLARERTQTLNR